MGRLALVLSMGGALFAVSVESPISCKGIPDGIGQQAEGPVATGIVTV
ncbi:hypothetical protein LCGC14_1354230 [marine sediment metagenome]|uniref:Uncharacterized protein n=1 Tax=marine sediment metagenome TaxID=412755 RepID=A0A0F9MQJ8_9ZZZZ